MDTKLTVKEIEEMLVEYEGGARKNICVPNVSFSMLDHEADLIVVNKSHYATEFEIKRSYEDFVADFAKKHRHEAEWVYKFVYVLPLSIKDKAMKFLEDTGGKDSQCIYHLAKMAGVRFEAHYSLTTLDPPELVRFIRSQYPDVVRDRPEKSFVQLCLGKGIMPTRVIRFCCSELKESQGKGFMTMIGIRKEESARRGKRNAVERIGRRKADRAEMDLTGMQESGFQCVKGSDRFTVAPILEWTHEDVWDFLNKVVKVPHCELYDKGRTRLGCLFCPMSSLNSIHRDEQEYPKYKAVLMRMIRRMIEAGCFQKIPDATPEDVWEWWIFKESTEKYLERKKQTKLF